ncbi:unnamed protein product [Hymenolepis diminuta]|uniref:RING-type domain-containing protein n=1 Tax=Hymenolepis diminuta TaxID=6216 RepID=A0A0R3SAC6_HYMDI|nr:unnamed protein product [Hymenolepis diminuta]
MSNHKSQDFSELDSVDDMIQAISSDGKSNRRHSHGSNCRHHHHNHSHINEKDEIKSQSEDIFRHLKSFWIGIPFACLFLFKEAAIHSVERHPDLDRVHLPSLPPLTSRSDMGSTYHRKFNYFAQLPDIFLSFLHPSQSEFGFIWILDPEFLNTRYPVDQKAIAIGTVVASMWPIFKPRTFSLPYQTNFISSKEDKELCPLCFEKRGPKLAILRCNHTFCRDCMDRWLIQGSECPLCSLFLGEEFTTWRDGSTSCLVYFF